jgi:hypothetical protein
MGYGKLDQPPDLAVLVAETMELYRNSLEADSKR